MLPRCSSGCSHGAPTVPLRELPRCSNGATKGAPTMLLRCSNGSTQNASTVLLRVFQRCLCSTVLRGPTVPMFHSA
ncbi:abc transporter g family member 3-like protein [Lasius niger]|uniref:Abc transporter g family member 3-like protein n=1 Tax=Lasius niger TaxID=67767 RepID=A0A0J7K1X3_LASNI|nr:abc transporter g family member 3-like protein [Lasius niger]